MEYNILIIEDEPSVSEMVKEYLEKENYRIHIATDGEDGLRAFWQSHKNRKNSLS